MHRRTVLKGGIVLAVTSHTAVAATSAKPQAMSTRDTVLWHMRELERLTKEAGADAASIIVVGRTKVEGHPNRYQCLSLDHNGHLIDKDDMFAIT